MYRMRAQHLSPPPFPDTPQPRHTHHTSHTLLLAVQEREGLRQQVRSLEDKCSEFQEALQCKMCRLVSPPVDLCAGSRCS